MKDQTKHRRHQRAELPFISADSFWAVNATGDDAQKWETGSQYGREAMAFAEQVEDSTDLFHAVIGDIYKKGPPGPLERGFLDALFTAALRHHNSLRLRVIESDEPIVYRGHVAPKNRPWRSPASQRPPDDKAITVSDNPAEQVGTEETDPELDRS